jgi:hypothetical protein
MSGLLGLIGSVGGGLMNFGAAEQLGDDIHAALDVKGVAGSLGYNLREVYGRKPNLPKWRFNQGELFKMLSDMGKRAASQGVGDATTIAQKSNEAATSQLEAAMARMFGGGEAFRRQRDLVNQNTENLLAGRLSGSTQNLLARKAISSGAVGLGAGTVSDAYAGYLGLTTEEIVSRGTQQYQSLYQGYRQSLPFVSASQMMPFTTLDAGQAVGARMQMEENRYQAMYNRALVAAAPDPMAQGHTMAEMQRRMAVAAADYQANSMLGGIFSSAMNGLGGLMGGSQSYNFGGGSLGGIGGLFG